MERQKNRGRPVISCNVQSAPVVPPAALLLQNLMNIILLSDFALCGCLTVLPMN